ncbi:unnamed protein product [Orchesella dallaii]|uniref:Uncharacterized protein n=1 Tax=Orchesella dallaii TaxID=48710 RepID=A0ABP1QHU3_9HEXA
MLDRIIQDIVASWCSWRVDMGIIDNPTVTQSPPTTASSPSSSSTRRKKNKQAIEDPEYYRITNRYPEHMLHCPQTSLYPMFFFLMERWEARRAASKETVLAATTTTTPVSNNNSNE